ncbi:MAG: Hsp20/alpha crystallin family protein [Deltaproteobacteria bacterium]
MFDLIPWRRREIDRARERSAADLWREMDNLFERFFGEAGRSEVAPGRTFAPAFDISETDDELVVRAELPGIDPKEVDINLTGDRLTIKGEKKEKKEERGESYHRVERSFGSFSRSFQLPCEVKEEDIKAVYKNGVLDLRLPKADNVKRKTFKIEVK